VKLIIWLAGDTATIPSGARVVDVDPANVGSAGGRGHLEVDHILGTLPTASAADLAVVADERVAAAETELANAKAAQVEAHKNADAEAKATGTTVVTQAEYDAAKAKADASKAAADAPNATQAQKDQAVADADELAEMRVGTPLVTVAPAPAVAPPPAA
jgi:hypothetical protein